MAYVCSRKTHQRAHWTPFRRGFAAVRTIHQPATSSNIQDSGNEHRGIYQEAIQTAQSAAVLILQQASELACSACYA